MKKLLAILLALVTALSLCACSKSGSKDGSDLDYIKKNGKLVIGYTVYAPMNYTDDDGNFVGFDTELATAVCKKLGVTPEFVEIDWNTRYTELAAKSIVCVWNGMTLTQEILDQTACTQAYAQPDCLMEVKAGTADAAILDLTLASAMIGEGTDYADLVIVDELNAEEYGVAFRKGSDVAAAVDAIFDELKADGTMADLAQKYGLTLAD